MASLDRSDKLVNKTSENVWFRPEFSWKLSGGEGEESPLSKVSPLISELGTLMSVVVSGLSEISNVVVGLSEISNVVVGLSEISNVVDGLSEISNVVVGLSEISNVVVGLSEMSNVVIGLSEISNVVVGLSEISNVVEERGSTSTASFSTRVSLIRLKMVGVGVDEAGLVKNNSSKKENSVTGSGVSWGDISTELPII